MTANHSSDPQYGPCPVLVRAFRACWPGLLCPMLRAFLVALMGGEAVGLCGSRCGVRSDERVNFRNGYRAREWDTRLCPPMRWREILGTSWSGC